MGKLVGALLVIVSSSVALADGRSTSYKQYYDRWLNSERSAFETSFSFTYWYRDTPAYNECSSFHGVVESFDKELRDYDRAYRDPVQKRLAHAENRLRALNDKIEQLKEKKRNKSDKLSDVEAIIQRIQNGKKEDPTGALLQAKQELAASWTEQIAETVAEIQSTQVEKAEQIELRDAAAAELGELNKRYSQLKLYLRALIDGHFLCHEFFCQQAATAALTSETKLLERAGCGNGSDVTLFTSSCEYQGLAEARNIVCPPN